VIVIASGEWGRGLWEVADFAGFLFVFVDGLYLRLLCLEGYDCYTVQGERVRRGKDGWGKIPLSRSREIQESARGGVNFMIIAGDALCDSHIYLQPRQKVIVGWLLDVWVLI
jgi:hypothetical protein